jgi:hypothetical protein
MILFAAIASALPPQQAQATARIVRGQRVTFEQWRRSRRKREIVVDEGGRKVTVRLIEFE